MSRSLQLELAHTHMLGQNFWYPSPNLLKCSTWGLFTAPTRTFSNRSWLWSLLLTNTTSWFHSLDQMNVPFAQRADASPEKWVRNSQVLWNTEVKGHTLELKCMCGLKNECWPLALTWVDSSKCFPKNGGEWKEAGATHSLTDCRKESFAFVLERHYEKTAPQVNTSTVIHPHFDYLTFCYDLLEKEKNIQERNIWL